MSHELSARFAQSAPQSLRRLPVWLLWRYEQGDRTKPLKVPYYARGSRRGGALDTPSDRAELVDFDTALAALQSGQYTGLGVALGRIPGTDGHLSGIDLDGLGERPEADDRAIEVLAAACSYAERSPSGKGLHILGFGDCGTRGNKGDGLEIYSSGRFFTFTGDRLNAADLGDITAAADLARRLWPTKGRAMAASATSVGTLAEGGRNSSLYSIGRRAKEAAGLNPGEVLALLSEVNRERCQPRLDEQEVSRIAHNIASAETDWARPVNLLNDLQAPPLDPAEVPGPLGEFAAAFAESSGIDPGFILLPAIATTAAMLSDQFSIIGDSRTSWLQNPRLWALLVGTPGSGKTPGMKEALAPAWAVHRELVAGYERELAAAGDDAKAPPRPRIIITDATLEALSQALADNPRGLLFASDEFETLLGSMNLYQGKGSASRDRGEWLKLFDGGPHSIERIQRGSTFVPNFGASVITATTPASLAKMARELPEDGLLQRFLVYRGRPIVPGAARLCRDAKAATEAYTALQRNVYGMRPRAHNGAAGLTHDAQEALRQFRARNAIEVEAVYGTQPALAGHLAKHPTLLLRLALTLHAAQVALEPDAHARDPAAWPVTLATLEQAERLLRRLTRHAMAVYTRLTGDTGAYALARDIARYLLAATPERVERRDLVQRVAVFRGGSDRDQSEALRLLEDLGWLRSDSGGYRKGAPTRFAVNPTLPVTMAEQVERERALRQARRELLTENITGKDAA